MMMVEHQEQKKKGGGENEGETENFCLPWRTSGGKTQAEESLAGTAHIQNDILLPHRMSGNDNPIWYLCYRSSSLLNATLHCVPLKAMESDNAWQGFSHLLQSWFCLTVEEFCVKWSGFTVKSYACLFQGNSYCIQLDTLQEKHVQDAALKNTPHFPFQSYSPSYSLPESHSHDR